MATKTLFHEIADGPAWDRWYLIAKADGTYDVEHAWSHPAVPGDAGTTVVSAGRFLGTYTDEPLLKLLRAAITKAVT